mgnify:CR=1 FL=1|jgi:hypothetical protein
MRLLWKLFLDDERDLAYIGEEGHLEWRVARSVEEAKKLVEKLGMPVEMSLDHDLGVVNGECSTTMEFLKWLQEWWDANKRPRVPDFQAHSANPVGVQNIRSFMRSWLRFEEMENNVPNS